MATSNGEYVCDDSEIPEGGALVFSPDETGADVNISIFRDQGTLYALDDFCSHEEVSLAEGFIGEGKVECIAHGAEFCLKTGAALTLPAFDPVAAHRVEVREGKVYLYPGVAPE
ncbi:Rieske 2Fe-2S domain-containing protein [Micrococcales bacterium 31B]|nr:Rieske 2Fe-2S domain-containing protein [Micrococcales bacterium 31B]